MKLAIRGRVVTMNDAYRVVADGIVWIDGRTIAAVTEHDAPRPQGFEDVKVLDTKGTLYPGLIELHNHLAYDVLKPWNVPKAFGNRGQWGGTESYTRDVTGPMKIVGRIPELLAAAVRWVECKALVAGVTSTQGIALFSNQGARRYYRGLVRNVESTNDAALPPAAARIADVDKRDAAKFKDYLATRKCVLLHLSEGVDDRARQHFLALETANGWALRDSLCGIHSVGLQGRDFDVLAEHGASMVWSPMSNLLLYGKTADVQRAREAGVRMGLGSDWSYTGSKNLLGELRIARICAAGSIPDRELVAMATREAARILRWDASVGTLEAGKRADLLVIDRKAGDAYATLLSARESNVELVVIDGVPRFGTKGNMNALGVAEKDRERVRIGGTERYVALRDEASDPAVATLTLSEAKERLTDAFAKLPKLAEDLESGVLDVPLDLLADGPPTWFLALDELSETGVDLRPRLPSPEDGEETGPTLYSDTKKKKLSEIVVPSKLDPLTVVDDEDWVPVLKGQRNVPDDVRRAYDD